MMHKLREKTKVIMLITALAFVGLMVFEWGMDFSGRSSAALTGGEIGRVNGDPITADEYNRVYQNLYDQQAQQQREPITTAQTRQIEDAAWNQLVLQRLLQQELRRRGIQVTETEIRQAARFSPPPEFLENELFHTDGQFDLAKYHQFLASPAADEQLLLQLEAYYRDVIPRAKLFQQVVAGIYVPDSELWRLWRDREERVRIRYLVLDPARLVADTDVSVTQQEIEAYYKANKDEFRQNARASVRMAVLEKAVTAEDSAAARARAEALREEILAGGDFEEIARRESADPGSAAQGGDLGTFSRGQMVQPFDQAVFSLPIGQVSEPVLTQFGYHLIRVESRNGDEARARHILIPIELTPESEDRLLILADSLETLGEKAASLEEAAQQLGLAVRPAELVEGFAFVPGVGPVDDAVEWALNEAEPGDVSPVFETPSAFYMVELVERFPASVLPLDEATPSIRATLAYQKKLERTRQIARGYVDEIRQGRTLDDLAATHQLEVGEAGPFSRFEFVPGIGMQNAVIGTAFGLAEGQISGVVEANNAVYIVQTVERVEADREAFEAQKELLRSVVMANLEQDRVNQFLNDLRDRAKIVDNRQTYRQQAAAATAGAFGW